MHDEVLKKEQRQLLPLIKQFAGDYYLAGGTAIALHIGHRRSIDFEKLFREQLCYFDDIDYSEKIEYVQVTIPDETIKEFLSEVATSEFK
jgi:hypothetical protein